MNNKVVISGPLIVGKIDISKVDSSVRPVKKISHTHCCYCRRKFTNENILTKDHFIPKSRMGYNGQNILQCCYECNIWKADKEPDVWLNEVEYMVKKNKNRKGYSSLDYRQIIGSLRHWIKHFKGKKISHYKY